MANALPNVWNLRTVANSASKACFICFKPSTKVLITPDSKDFFYVCAGHLNDTGFATPIVDEEAEAAKRKKAEMDLEIEKVKREYEEKQRKKKTKQKDKDEDEKADEESKKAEKERDSKISAIKSGEATSIVEAGPRVFALHRNFYQMRIDRLRNVQLAKQKQQRMQDPNLFPTVPKGDIV